MLLPVDQNFLQLLYADDLLLLCKARISEVFYSNGVLGKVLFVVWPSNKQRKIWIFVSKGVDSQFIQQISFNYDIF